MVRRIWLTGGGGYGFNSMTGKLCHKFEQNTQAEK